MLLFTILLNNNFNNIVQFILIIINYIMLISTLTICEMFLRVFKDKKEKKRYFFNLLIHFLSILGIFIFSYTFHLYLVSKCLFILSCSIFSISIIPLIKYKNIDIYLQDLKKNKEIIHNDIKTKELFINRNQNINKNNNKLFQISNINFFNLIFYIFVIINFIFITIVSNHVSNIIVPMLIEIIILIFFICLNSILKINFLKKSYLFFEIILILACFGVYILFEWFLLKDTVTFNILLLLISSIFLVPIINSNVKLAKIYLEDVKKINKIK